VADLDATPAKTLYVGNSLENDVAGAQAAGFRTAWFPVEDHDGDRNGHDPDFTFETLHDLADVL
jgi:FMN phosphatase YigB (HAD superfamily)